MNIAHNTPAVRSSYSRLVAKVHIAKAQLGLDDTAYRATLQRIAGQNSAADCTAQQLQAVLAHFEKAGFTHLSKGHLKAFKGPAARMVSKIRALWLSGWNLGVIEDKTDAAMESFIKRQTGIDKAQWLQDPKDAAAVIEALKAWLARDGGVKWSLRDGVDDVFVAQLKRLRELGVDDVRFDLSDSSSSVEEQRQLGAMIRKAMKA